MFTPDGPTGADDPLLLYFTSGTTARPKLVLHSHASYPVGHLSTMFGLGLKPGDSHLNISSPGWAKHAWSNVFAPWNAGACILAMDKRFDARGTLDDLVAHEVTSFCAPPTVWRQLVQLPLENWRTSLRELNSAGEPLNPEVIEQVRRAWGLSLRDSYGQTETTMMVGNAVGQRVVAGSMGRPLPGYRVVLLDADGREADEGEIAMPLNPRPLGLMRGYQEDDGSLRPLEGEHYRTGDVATRDASGYITYVGRADDVFKSNDYRLSPFELESALIEHEAVQEAAVVPAPDPARLAVAKAYIVLADGVPRTARNRARHLSLPQRAPGALQARAAARIRRPAEDDLGKDPPRRAARARERVGESGDEGRGRIPHRGFCGAEVGAPVQTVILEGVRAPAPRPAARSRQSRGREMAISEILPFFGVYAKSGAVVAPIGGFNLIYHSLGRLRDIGSKKGDVTAKDITDSFRKAPDFAQVAKTPNPLFSDDKDSKAFAQAALTGLGSQRLLAVFPHTKGAHKVNLVGARESQTITVISVAPRPAKISFRYLKYTGPWPPDGPGTDASRFSQGVSRTKGEGADYADKVDKILRHQAVVTVTLQSSEDVNISTPFGPQVVNDFFKGTLRPLADKAADVTIFVVPAIAGAYGREFPEDRSSVMVAEKPKVILLDTSLVVDEFATIAAHELAHALGAPHNYMTDGLLMSGPEQKQGLLLDQDGVASINSPYSGSKK